MKAFQYCSRAMGEDPLSRVAIWDYRTISCRVSPTQSGWRTEAHLAEERGVSEAEVEQRWLATVLRSLSEPSEVAAAIGLASGSRIYSRC